MWRKSTPLLFKNIFHKILKDIETKEKILKFIKDDKQYIKFKTKDIKYINQPIILVSQLPRSGGSLVAQLFDSHEELYSFPDEVKIGYPIKYIWPKLKLNKNPKYWFYQLFNLELAKIDNNNYWKGHQHKFKQGLSFKYSPKTHYENFIDLVKNKKNINEREIINSYMSSFFYSWIDYNNMNGNKKYIICFQPMLNGISNYTKNFFTLYPDSFQISLIRDPYNWFNSSIRHVSIKNSFKNFEEGMNYWLKFNDDLLSLKRKYKDRVILLNYETLINQTESTMKFICNKINIKYNKNLINPTFNNYQIMANSSYPVNNYGILKKINRDKNKFKNLSNDDFTLKKKIDISYKHYLSNIDI